MELLSVNETADRKQENQIIIEDPGQTPKKKEEKHKFENFINCLSPIASQWDSIEKILRPNVRFLPNAKIEEGQEIEVSPIST
jgi:hypothetical protein